MGLFSDDLKYRDFDALCIQVKRKIGDLVVELPVYVDARISYVTWNNANDVILDGSSVKELKKSGRLTDVMKPIFEKYIAEAVNARSDYAQAIYPDDFFGETKIEFSEKRAKELIDSRLFKETLVKIKDPEGFDKVKFEKIYGISPVGYKVWNVTSGVCVPYDYTELVNGKDKIEITRKEVNSAPESHSKEPIDESVVVERDKGQVDLPQKTVDKEVPLNLLSSEYEELKRKCELLRVEIGKYRMELDGRIRGKETLEKTLNERQALVAQYEQVPAQIAEIVTAIKKEASRRSALEKEKNVMTKELESLCEMISFKETILSIVNKEYGFMQY